jgi:hypothetical protein
MDVTWSDVLQPLVAGLAGVLGVYGMQDLLKALERRGVTLPWHR